MSGEFLSVQEIAAAAHLAGKDYTAKEIAEEIGRSERSVRISLGAVGISLKPKPFGFRPVTVTLSPVQVEGLRAAADRQGRAGSDRHAMVLEQAARRLGAEPDALASLLDPTMTPIFFSADLVERMKGEAIRRRLNPQELAARILATVLDDDIVAAVLDVEEGDRQTTTA